VIFSFSRNSLHGILLDIEGTTTPIDFVYEVLFPYARLHLEEYLKRWAGSEELERDLLQLREEHVKDVAEALAQPEWIDAPPDAQMQSVARYVLWLMDRDRKSPGLKSLQGKIWQVGYLKGELKSRVFPDVPPALKDWKEKNLDVRIFSSGSLLAQRLLFANTQAGDLSGFLNGYFDTGIGPKTSAESYRRIAAEFHVAASEVLFVSDVIKELDAASSSGMKTLLSIRPDNPPQPKGHAHGIIRSFSEILIT
jgi:enolase-phosphatase E1